MKNIFLTSFFVLVLFLLVSCTKGTFEEKSFQDVKTAYTIKSSGKSNKEFIDAIDIWGAEIFGNWSKVKQISKEEKGIFIFRYLDRYDLVGNVCKVMVSVRVKRKDEKKLSVNFSNIVRFSGCGWINKFGVEQLTTNFGALTKRLERVIANYE